MAEATHRARDAEPGTPGSLSMPGRAMTIAAMEQLVTRIAEGAGPAAGRSGSEYLLFTCGQVPCAVPLAQLREVLPALPRPVPLPFSPPWLLGVFPLRLDVLGLVDPAPLLLGGQSPQLHVDNAATALVAGDDVLLALAVSSVGDIALVQPDEMRGDDTRGDGARVDPRYAQGVYTPASGGTYVAINMPRLVDDLVRALMEDAAHE